MREKFILLLALSVFLLIPISQAEAAMNPNLSVSAENSKFNNHFSGSMVVEVVIRDSSIGDTDEGKGEPDVTINGKSLRMVQATDGNWYAYFANVNKAKIADSTVGLAGEGLDFGVFCSRDTTVLWELIYLKPMVWQFLVFQWFEWALLMEMFHLASCTGTIDKFGESKTMLYEKQNQ